MKNILIPLGCLFLYSSISYSQNLQLEWVEYESKYSNFFINDISADSAFIYVSGEIVDTSNFNFNNTSYNYLVNGGTDAYWGRYRKSGFTLESFFSIAGPGREYISDIENDKLGNVYICCMFDSSGLDIAPLETDTFTINSYGGRDILIAKYNSTGHLLWSRHIGGATSRDGASKLKLDDLGNLYVVGSFSGNVLIDSSTSQVINRVAGYSSPFVAKYDSSGLLQWINMPNSNNANAVDISVDSKKMAVITGSVQDSIYLGSQWYNTTSPTSFLAVIDSNGIIIWGDTLEGDFSNTQRILIDNQYIYFVTNHNDNSINLAKYDFSGNRIFKKSLFCTGELSVREFSMQDSSVLLFASFSDTLFLDSIFAGGYITTDSPLHFGIVVTKCDKNGNWQWAETMSSTGSTGGAVITSVLLDENSIYLGLNVFPLDTISLINIAFSPESFYVPKSKAIAKYHYINTGTNKIENGIISKLKLFPNPTHNILMIQSEQNISRVLIYDLNGRIIKEEKYYAVPISLAALPTGQYIAVAYNEQGQICGSEKFIKLD